MLNIFMKTNKLILYRNHISFLILLICSILIANNSNFNSHPDEYAHIDAFKYFQGKIFNPNYDIDNIVYSPYGWSRVYTNEVVYKIFGNLLFISKFVKVKQYILLRYCNILLLIIFYLYLTLRKIPYFENNNLSALILCFPQLIYLFSYANSDAFGLITSAILCLETLKLTSTIPTKIKTKEVCLFSLLASITLLTKVNYYFSILFCVSIFINYFVNNKYKSAINFQFVKKTVLAISILLFITGPYLILNPILHYNTKINENNMREHRAEIDFRPSSYSYEGLKLYKKNTSIHNLIIERHFIQKTLGSFWGYYGYMTINHTSTFYFLIYGLIFMLCIINLYFYLHFRKKYNHIKLLLYPVSIVISILLLAGIALNSYYNDFQPQGRYLYGAWIPISIAISAFINKEKRALFFTSEVIKSLLIVLSCYSLISKLII